MVGSDPASIPGEGISEPCDVTCLDGAGVAALRAPDSCLWHQTPSHRFGLTSPRRIWRALLLCEVNNFQTLRRHVGLPGADALLGALADRIASIAPSVRLTAVGRALLEISFDADCFERCEELVVDLRARFAQPLEIDGGYYLLDLRVGGAAITGSHRDEVRLVEGAEAALRKAHYDGIDVIRDLTRESASFDSLTLMRELSGAIQSDQMFLQYQPKVHVRRQEVASVEALVRWQHPERGLILPGDFIQVAEQAGLIGDLTRWTLRQAIADQRIMAADGHILTVFLNISGVLLADRSFIESACRMICDSGARIGFEITETAVIREPEKAIEHLEMLAQLGVQIAIDDYGAGLSSLAYLKKLPASELKIDKGFVLQLTSSNRDPLIVRSTIDLAHALDMEVTAEGVETPAALALLSVMGCDMVQGYLLGRPVGLDAFLLYLADERHLSAVASGRPSFYRPETFWKRA